MLKEPFGPVFYLPKYIYFTNFSGHKAHLFVKLKKNTQIEV